MSENPAATAVDPALGRNEWLRRHGMAALERMRTIREVESRLTGYVQEGLIKGSTHPSVGMEAVAVGVALCLEPADTVASTHRGHGHCLAKGAEPPGLLAELFGRSTGYCGGKGGSMHLASRSLGLLGTNGIVGASIGIATGAALAAKLADSSVVAVAFFGDGAINQGIFHEALNLASIWSLPVLYVCENNQYAQSAPIAEMAAVADLTDRAASYAIPGERVDGMDVSAVWQAAARAVARARDGRGPTLLVAETWRYLGHMVGDTEIYRTPAETEPWRERDPIAQLERWLLELGIPAAELERRAATVKAAVDDAEAAAKASPVPALATAFTDVYGDGSRDAG
jgi:TPP-dependent pyruvate/acetoin dehydrogenase alpha subunit